MLRATVLTLCLLFAMFLAAAATQTASVRPVLAQPEPCDWTGVWLPFEGEWRMAQNGTGVSGSYLDGKGIISGTVDGNVLHGEWKEPPSYSPPFESGHFNVSMSADCSAFNGTWGLGDADCCNVLSAIRNDDAPPSLAVQVERGTLVVEGQTILTGATYFPPTCPAPSRSPTDGCSTFVLGSETGLKFSCFLNRFVRVLLVLESVKLSAEDEELFMDIVITKLQEKCGILAARQDDWALNLAVRQGAAHMAGAVEGQTVSVAAGPATSTLNGAGSFLVAYDTAAGMATFHAYSSPLDIQPQGGAAFLLPAYSWVEVTAAGAGPVTSLSRLYLPMQRR